MPLGNHFVFHDKRYGSRVLVQFVVPRKSEGEILTVGTEAEDAEAVVASFSCSYLKVRPPRFHSPDLCLSPDFLIVPVNLIVRIMLSDIMMFITQ